MIIKVWISGALCIPISNEQQGIGFTVYSASDRSLVETSLDTDNYDFVSSTFEPTYGAFAITVKRKSSKKTDMEMKA